MAKRYNITFNTESDYLSFKASSAYCEPNVSLTINDNTVHFNPLIIRVNGVTLNENSIEINEGDTQLLVATITPNDATDKSITWATSNSNVATVDSNGLVTTVGDGNCTITVTTNDGGHTAQCSVTVVSPYVDLDLPSGTLWARCNIGATHETDYGDYYQYGKGADNYYITSGQSLYNGSENPLAASADTATQVLGGSCHMPTKLQCEELTANTSYSFQTNFKGSGVNGSKFTSKTDPNKYIFIPAAGFYWSDMVLNEGENVRIWSSTPDGSSKSYYLSGRNISDDSRDLGYTMRAVIG